MAALPSRRALRAQALRAAARWKPAPKAWLNLGDMLLDVTAELQDLQRRRQLLSEARDAYSMALTLDSTSTEARNGGARGLASDNFSSAVVRPTVCVGRSYRVLSIAS